MQRLLRNFSALLVITFTVGCARVKLFTTTNKSMTTNEFEELMSADGTFSLSPPATRKGHRRLVIFLDMSFSMLTKNCDGDVNNPSEPSQPISGVKPVAATSPPSVCKQEHLATGRDPNGVRFDLIKEWLKPLATETNIKFMIVPFTGGVLERAKPRVMAFKTYNETIKIIDDLKKEQEKDKLVFTNLSLFPASMGTSVPLTRLNNLVDLVYAEMEKQKNSGELVSSTYDVFYISDGQPTPTRAHYQTTLNLVRLPAGKTCNPECILDPTKCAPIGYNDTGRCRQAREEMADLWGEVKDNEVNLNLRQWRFLMGLPNVFLRGKIKLHLGMLWPEKLTPEEKTPSTNFLYSLKAQFEDAKWSEITSALPPYPLTETVQPLERYTIRHLFVVNPNVRVNASGQQALDSDGDGLFDVDEAAHGKNPYKARTSGLCLDSLSIQEAYQTRCAGNALQLLCDNLSDSDGDGLNECEEKIIGTSYRLVDSDSDGIPDGLEVVYGFNPLRSDAELDSNSDGMINLEHFHRGLSPNQGASSLNPSWLVQLERSFLGFLPGASGSPQATYKITLKNFPYSNINQTSTPIEMYYADAHLAALALPERLQVISSPVFSLSNRIGVYMAISSADRPEDVIWMLKKANVSAANLGTSVNLDLSTLEKMNTYDQ